MNFFLVLIFLLSTLLISKLRLTALKKSIAKTIVLPIASAALNTSSEFIPLTALASVTISLPSSTPPSGAD